MAKSKAKGRTQAIIVAAVVGGGALVYWLSRREPHTTDGVRGLGAFPSRQGSYYANTPRALQNLTFNQLRQQEPLDSPGTIQAIEQYIAGQPEVVASMPQNMGFNRWRQGGGTFGGNIAALLTATTARDPLLNELVGTENDRVPHMSLHDTAQAMNALPQEPPAYGRVISRGVPGAQVIPAPQFWAYADYGGQTPLTPMSPFEQGLEYETVWDGERMELCWRVPRVGAW